MRSTGEDRFDDIRVDGRPGYVRSTRFEPDGGEARRLITTAEDGSLLIVVSQRPFPIDQLVDIAEGVEPVDEATWQRQVELAESGPG